MKALNKYFSMIFIIIIPLLFVGCGDFFDPENDNHDTSERLKKDPVYAEGLLMTAYSSLPTSNWSFNDVATDDAVTNDKFNYYLRMGTGQWSADFNPVNNWDATNRAILYLNLFLSQVDSITWDWNSSDKNRLFKDRMTGEAYALRGVFRYYLLRNIAGKSKNGEMLGIPLFDGHTLDNSSDMKRADFTASVAAINSDFDKASEYLPMDFLNIAIASQLPAKYSEISIENYNTVFGVVSNQRITKRIVMGFKSKLSLLAASPAFNLTDDKNLWQAAADAASEVLLNIPLRPGITGLDPTGHQFFTGTNVNRVTVTNDSREMLWRGAAQTSNTLEKRIYPPSLNGNGEINPSQNLVDAFPMKNGYPIHSVESTYDSSKPYANRDTRLTLYIIYNDLSIQGQKILTGLGGGVNAKDSIATSTRTGYYMRKLIREDVIFSDDGTANLQKHYPVHLRYTEIFLNYAEAANEVWGPTGTDVKFTSSAKDVIAAIRKRAGITQPDRYLNSITTKEEMRDLIRNERRLELCFEGFRFWDMRRWGLDLTEKVKGVNLLSTGQIVSYVDVEPRVYKPFMQYAPLPRQETLKFPNLEQNEGW